MKVPVVNMQATGEKIVQLRIRKGLSVKDLQRIFGFTTPQAIYKWQQGLSMPTIDNILILSSIFGVSLEQILVTDLTEI